MRVAAIVWCAAIPGLQVYLFRRVYDDLVKNHMEGPKGFRALLAPWEDAGWCRIVEDEIRFWNGSKIYLCHCEHEKHIYKYQGAEIHVLLIDELTHFTEQMYRFLRGRCRQVGVPVPAQYQGTFPRIMCGANPGNVGHLWVKDTFIANTQPLTIRLMSSPQGGMRRQYIPARLDDNPSLLEDDPGYEARLDGLGSKTLVAAMRWGDWDVVEGAFFDCWSHKLILPPFTIPTDWIRFRSMDWGSASPASIGWWAVVQDDYHLQSVVGEDRHETGRTLDAGSLARRRDGSETEHQRRGTRQARVVGAADGRGRILPRGALVRYREDYIADERSHKGLKLTAELVAQRIIDREKHDPKLSYGVLDPSCFREDGGPPISERINRPLLDARIAPFRKADNTRVPRLGYLDRSGPMSGWDAVRARMIGVDGVPLIYCFDTCFDSIRTIPVCQHDPARAEDLWKIGEDHCADEWRYACLSRSYRRSEPEKDVPRDGYSPPSEEIPSDNVKTL